MVYARGFWCTPLHSDKDAVGLQFFLTFPILMLTTTLPNLKAIEKFLGGLRSLQKKLYFSMWSFRDIISKNSKHVLTTLNPSENLYLDSVYTELFLWIAKSRNFCVVFEKIQNFVFLT